MPVAGDSVIDGTTVNVVVTLLIPPLSLSSREYGPAGIDGTMNQVVRLYALDPVARGVCGPNVVPAVANRLDRDAPRVAVATLVKPTTVMVTFAPTIPEDAEVVIVGVPSMVKDADAVSVGLDKVRVIV